MAWYQSCKGGPCCIAVLLGIILFSAGAVFAKARTSLSSSKAVGTTSSRRCGSTAAASNAMANMQVIRQCLNLNGRHLTKLYATEISGETRIVASNLKGLFNKNYKNESVFGEELFNRIRPFLSEVGWFSFEVCLRF